jgi:hypothetical protein
MNDPDSLQTIAPLIEADEDVESLLIKGDSIG